MNHKPQKAVLYLSTEESDEHFMQHICEQEQECLRYAEAQGLDVLDSYIAYPPHARKQGTISVLQEIMQRTVAEEGLYILLPNMQAITTDPRMIQMLAHHLKLLGGVLVDVSDGAA